MAINPECKMRTNGCVHDAHLICHTMNHVEGCSRLVSSAVFVKGRTTEINSLSVHQIGLWSWRFTFQLQVIEAKRVTVQPIRNEYWTEVDTIIHACGAIYL